MEFGVFFTLLFGLLAIAWFILPPFICLRLVNRNDGLDYMQRWLWVILSFIMGWIGLLIYIAVYHKKKTDGLTRRPFHADFG